MTLDELKEQLQQDLLTYFDGYPMDFAEYKLLIRNGETPEFNDNEFMDNMCQIIVDNFNKFKKLKTK